MLRRYNPAYFSFGFSASTASNPEIVLRHVGAEGSGF
jgi:hypothetical protein